MIGLIIILFLAGLSDTKSDFLVTQWRKHVTFAQQECHTNARRLLTVATPNNYEDFMTKITKYNRAGSYIIGKSFFFICQTSFECSSLQ